MSQTPEQLTELQPPDLVTPEMAAQIAKATARVREAEIERHAHLIYVNEKPDSVEISRNAKGETSVSVKAYGKTPDEAMAQALSTFQRTKQALGL